MGKYAQIVFGLPLKEPFDYAIPDSLFNELEVGKRVFVPFGKSCRVGYCIGKVRKSRSTYTKEIISVLDEEIIFSEKFLFFLKELSKRYFACWGEMIELAIPPYLRKPKKNLLKEKTFYEIKNSEFEFSTLTQKIIEKIKNREGDKFLIFEDYFQNKRFILYYELTNWMLKNKKDVLILTPEIYIAEELASFFKDKNFPYEIILYHSGLKEKDSFRNWLRIKEGFPKLIIGTKMAVFHPQENIGLIMVEDEGSPFYKHEEFPFYNARDVSLFRAYFFKIPLILSGNPPSVETYYKMEKNILSLIDLREKSKIGFNTLVVDLAIGKVRNYITKSLELKVSEILDKKEKVFLFLNRRGFATFIKCRKCGKVLKCLHCDRNLIYHFSAKKLICHYCGKSQETPSFCPDCQASYLHYQGLGTEKLESELSRMFPKARILRIDLDVKKEKTIKDLLRYFQEDKIDILIGTSLFFRFSLLAKFGLVGIINLEQGINFPDFRAGERLFSLLVNFLRLIKEGGFFLIQSHNPENKLIGAFKDLDYETFYKEELKLRKDLGFPPFKNIVILNLRGRSRKSVENNAQVLVKKIKDKNVSREIFVSEALPHHIFKLRDKYRWQIFIKYGNIKKIFSLLEEVLAGKRKFRGSILTVDVEFDYKEGVGSYVKNKDIS